jgi:hypothetical protein
MTALPRIAPAVLAEVVDQLPPRLRRRLDAAVPTSAQWTVQPSDDGATAQVAEDTTLRWRLHDGVLTSGVDLTCDCLLAPNCLHRAIAVAGAEVGEAAADVVEVAATAMAAEVVGRPPETSTPATATELAAANALTSAGARLLDTGLTGSGTMTRAELLRAVHAARIAGLHRPAAAGLRIAAILASANGDDPSFTRSELAEELTELLLTCHDLTEGVGEPADLRGIARREYQPIGARRLTGLCTETVCTGSGYAGVISHVVDADGVLWSIPAVLPGGPERIRAAAGGPVATGESGLSHSALARNGVLLSSGTASADRRLGSGASVRAVRAAGAAWTDEPLAALWRQPLTDQVARAFAAADRPDGLRPSGDGLLFLKARVSGIAGDALRVQVDARPVDLLGADRTATDNLHLLAALPDAELLVVARLRTDLPATATAIAVSAAPEMIRLPSALADRVDLGLDRMQRSYLADAQLPRAFDTRTTSVRTPIQLLEHWVQRVVICGRPMAAIASADTDRIRLSRLGLTGTAGLLAELSTAARDQHRDTFGRLMTQNGNDFTRAWLRAALHSRAFHHHLTERSWHPPE